MFSKTVAPSLPGIEYQGGLPAPRFPVRHRKKAPGAEFDEFEILTGGLKVKFIEAVIEILKEQFPNTYISIQGVEGDHTDPRLHRETNARQTCHAHVHIYNGHATLSIRFEGNKVWYIDSQAPDGIERTENIQGHQQQLFNAYQERFKLRFLYVQQQKPESVDCGVFVIAFLVQVLHDNSIENLQKITFAYDEMRPHLLKCYKNNEFTPFPEEKV